MKKQRKTVWITGASSGIGLAFAHAYAQKGYRLILTARREERLKKIAARLDVPCRIVAADLSSEAECKKVCEVLKQEQIDIFINNAGYGTCGDFLETDLDKELGMIRVNVEAMHILCKEVLRQMEFRGHGTILNVASSAGLLPGGPYMATYYATKSYVVSLTKSIHEELRRKKCKVYVCALCPGPVDTEFFDIAGSNVKPLKRMVMAKPENVVEQAIKDAALGNELSIYGKAMKLAYVAGRFLPHRLLLRFF